MNASSNRSIGPISLLLMAEAWWELLRARVRILVPSGRAKWLRNVLRISSGRHDPLAIDKLTVAVNRASQYHVRPMRCLDRSLAIVCMLRRRGIATALKIGCRRQGEVLDFHAWMDGTDDSAPVANAGGPAHPGSPNENAFLPFDWPKL
jgi:hypothetical protein